MKRLLTFLFAVSCLTAVGQVPEYVPTEGLVAWWAFDGDVQDASDNQIHGTSYAASFVPDRFNNDDGAIHMEGNGLVDFGLDPRFGVVSGAGRTVAFWVKSEMEVIPRLQKYQNSVSGNSNFFVGPAAYPNFSPANGITVTANGQTAYGTVDLDWPTWFHLAVVYDGATGESSLFIDGVPVASESLTFNTNVSSKPLQLVAARVNNDYPDSNGEVDDMGFWQRVLTHDEILDLFEAPAPITGCTNLSACNFDEEAVFDDGSCEESGCTDSFACNYTDEASCDDGSCDYSCCPGPGCCGEGSAWNWQTSECDIVNPADINLDGCVQLNDLLDLLSAYGDCGAEETPWQCGDPLEYQGYNYETVQIGDQCWFAENLRAENYRNGESIVYSGAASDWETNGYTGLGSRAAYNDDALLGALWGYIYNGFAVNDERALCPTGWIVPKNADWLELGEFLGGMSVAGQKMKNSPNDEFGWNGDNSSGFGGYATGDRHWPDGSFNHALDGSVGDNEQVIGLYWSGAPGSIPAQNYYALYEMDDQLTQSSSNGPPLGFGAAVRCIKDSE